MPSFIREKGADGKWGKRVLRSTTEKPQVAALRNADGTRLDGKVEDATAGMTTAQIEAKPKKDAAKEAKAETAPKPSK